MYHMLFGYGQAAYVHRLNVNLFYFLQTFDASTAPMYVAQRHFRLKIAPKTIVLLSVWCVVF